MNNASIIARPEAAWWSGMDPLVQLTVATFSGHVGDGSRRGVMPVSDYLDLFEAVGTDVNREDLLHIGGVLSAFDQSRLYYVSKVAEHRSADELAETIRAIGRLGGGTEATDQLAVRTAQELKGSRPAEAFDALWAMSTLVVLQSMLGNRDS
jgi:hypothetical protein